MYIDYLDIIIYRHRVHGITTNYAIYIGTCKTYIHIILGNLFKFKSWEEQECYYKMS